MHYTILHVVSCLIAIRVSHAATQQDVIMMHFENLSAIFTERAHQGAIVYRLAVASVVMLVLLLHIAHGSPVKHSSSYQAIFTLHLHQSFHPWFHIQNPCSQTSLCFCRCHL